MLWGKMIYFIFLDMNDGESGFHFIIAVVIFQNFLNIALFFKKKKSLQPYIKIKRFLSKSNDMSVLMSN